MSVIRVIREFPPNKLQEEECGTFTILPEEPRTPQIRRGVDDNNLLSSPFDQYRMIFAQSPPVVRLQHKETDRGRLKGAKSAISKLEDVLVEKMREARKEHEEEMTGIRKEREMDRKEREKDRKEREEERRLRKERDNLVLEWETFDRFTQGLIDHIRSVVMNNSEPEDLSKAKVIWGDTNRYLYLPHLFTQWWLSWAQLNPDSVLPSALNLLSLSDKSNFQSRRSLSEDIDEAAKVLWYSSLQDMIHLMLRCYHKRLQARNDLQHPVPSTDFAYSFVDSDLELSDEQRITLQFIIDSGKRHDGTSLFDHSTAPAPSPAPPPLPVPGPLPSLASASQAMDTTRGTTRQRDSESDDDRGMAVKKHKRGE